MCAANYLAVKTGDLAPAGTASEINAAILNYGDLPPLTGIAAENLVSRLRSDKKTIQGTVHFVLPVRIGEVVIRSGIGDDLILSAARQALAELGWQ